MLNQLISGLKKKFSITIFHKKQIAIFCGTFYLAPKPLKKEHLWQFGGYKNPLGIVAEMLQTPCFSALGAKKSATENGNFFNEKWLY